MTVEQFIPDNMSDPYAEKREKKENGQIHVENGESESNYLTHAELERYYAATALGEIAQHLVDSDDENNSNLGRVIVNMAEDLLDTLPKMGNVIDLNVKVTNNRVSDNELDDIITNFIGL